MADDISAVGNIIPVSRETGARLEAFVALLRKWQPVENLISPKTLPELWTRHVADCAQLVRLFPGSRRWLDMGTGAGFPGMVVAILNAGQEGAHVALIESNTRKCAFLRAAIRATGAPATVHEGRIEDVLRDWRGPVDRVTARAVAPLDQLLALAEPLMAQGTPAAFLKGQDYQAEIDKAALAWTFVVEAHPSQVGDGGAILEVSALRRKPNQAKTPA